MHLLSCPLFVEARHRCYLHPVYFDTHATYLADALSPDNLPLFLSKHADAAPLPSPTSPHLLDVLLDPSADRTSPHWSHRFKAAFNAGGLN